MDNRITREDIDRAARIAGLSFTQAEREAMFVYITEQMTAFDLPYAEAGAQDDALPRVE